MRPPSPARSPPARYAQRELEGLSRAHWRARPEPCKRRAHAVGDGSEPFAREHELRAGHASCVDRVAHVDTARRMKVGSSSGARARMQHGLERLAGVDAPELGIA